MDIPRNIWISNQANDKWFKSSRNKQFMSLQQVQISLETFKYVASYFPDDHFWPRYVSSLRAGRQIQLLRLWESPHWACHIITLHHFTLSCIGSHCIALHYTHDIHTDSMSLALRHYHTSTTVSLSLSIYLSISLSLYIYIYIYTQTCIHTHVYILYLSGPAGLPAFGVPRQRVQEPPRGRLNDNIYIYIYIWVYKYVYIYIYVCMYVYIYIYIFVCMYVYIYI